MADKFTALWISHSSISDFLRCPRAYYLGNVYRDPRTRRKITLINPSLALGQAVHKVVESLSALPVSERFRTPLLERLNHAWQGVAGTKGGFRDEREEAHYKERARQMLKRVEEKPGPLTRLAVKIRKDLPYFWLSEADEIILCGKIDWLEYLPETDSVHIIDFKTGKSAENPTSLQLPIYYLLASSCQKHPVVKASYWYLDVSDELTDQPLPDPDKARDQLLKIAKKIKLARKINHFVCPAGDEGCPACRPLEAILRGDATLVGTNDYRQDVYVLNTKLSNEESESVII